MFNFQYYNPVRIVFGKNTIAELKNLISRDKKILLTYGGGSIFRNGVYDQVKSALTGYNIVEFGGIQPNPEYDTLIKAVDIARSNNIDFLLAVGGGSVIDGTKFIAAAICFEDGDPWDICAKGAPVKNAVPLGTVLTLPATGSEMNCFSVVSRASRVEKLHFSSPYVFPKFSILDPETTFSLPRRQVANGIVDAFVHVTEQYLTYCVNTPLQDRQAQAILKTLIEIAPATIANPSNYDCRANFMWCATQALNGIIGCGVAQDWTAHMIGHELTALFGIDHGQSLSVIAPAVWRHQRAVKKTKLLEYAYNVWNISAGSDEEKINSAIDKTIDFFRSIDMPVTLKDCNIVPGNFANIADRLAERGMILGENQNIGRNEVVEILNICSG